MYVSKMLAVEQQRVITTATGSKLSSEGCSA
jgi:hypothetical protein